MDVYVLCNKCDCYVDQTDCTLLMGYTDFDVYICFECQP